MTSRRAIVLAGLAGVMLGIASSLVVERVVLAQSRGTRGVIRPEKGPTTGLPFRRNSSAESPVPDPTSATAADGVRAASAQSRSSTPGGYPGR